MDPLKNTGEFNSNFSIPITTNSIIPPPPPSVMDLSTWSYDNSVQWNTQPAYSGYIPALFPPQPTPAVIAAPAALNINGMKRKFDKEIISELHDPALPKELTGMFQPLYCKLCITQLNSSSNAKLHYQSKNHLKKIRKYLTEYSAKTGEPLHKMAKMSNKKSETFYCATCDLQLTSKLHAEQHYMGKNHLKAVRNQKAPKGPGQYDKNGQWHRSEKVKPDLTGRFTIGLDFAKPEEIEAAKQQQHATTLINAKYFCDLCQVSCTSSEHLQMHLIGQRHLKTLKKKSSELPAPTVMDPFGDLTAVPVIGPQIPKDNILSSLMNTNQEKKDYSVYRTPSGSYYCGPCNVTLNSEPQFVQHLESKKHLKKKSGSLK